MATGSNGLTWKGCDVLDARRRASSGHRPAAVISFQHAHGLTADGVCERGDGLAPLEAVDGCLGDGVEIGNSPVGVAA